MCNYVRVFTSSLAISSDPFNDEIVLKLSLAVPTLVSDEFGLILLNVLNVTF